jgi:hypothetical protein
LNGFDAFLILPSHNFSQETNSSIKPGKLIEGLLIWQLILLEIRIVKAVALIHTGVEDHMLWQSVLEWSDILVDLVSLRKAGEFELFPLEARVSAVRVLGVEHQNALLLMEVVVWQEQVSCLIVTLVIQEVVSEISENLLINDCFAVTENNLVVAEAEITFGLIVVGVVVVILVRVWLVEKLSQLVVFDRAKVLGQSLHTGHFIRMLLFTEWKASFPLLLEAFWFRLCQPSEQLFIFVELGLTFTIKVALMSVSLTNSVVSDRRV